MKVAVRFLMNILNVLIMDRIMTAEQQAILELRQQIMNLREATRIELDDINKSMELLLTERERKIAKEIEANQSFRRMN